MTDSSILNDIKKLLGSNENCTSFDTDIVIFVNGILATISQVGVKSNDVLQIIDGDDTWEDLFGNDERLNFIQNYIFIKAKLLFDPPTSSAVIQSFENQAKELEWRINVESDK